jgi:RHS repeat-associated protein
MGLAMDNALGLGLLHMGARHYSPSLGRFLQPDPSALEANLYAYAANSPVTKVDPSGLWTWFARRLYKQIDAAGLAAATTSWAVCAPLKGKVAGFICAMAMYLLFAEEGVPYLQIDIFYQRSAAMTIAVPVKKAFGRWVVGTGGLLMIYWTPRNAGMKCAEVLAGIRGPYGASLLCGNRVTKVRW